MQKVFLCHECDTEVNGGNVVNQEDLGQRGCGSMGCFVREI